MTRRHGIGSHHSAAAASVEWFTPPEILAELGPFDLDPCTSVDRPWDTAAHHYTMVDDGLARRWWGRCWVNPPYGAAIVRWMARLAEHGRGTALVFARTETAWWFQHVWPVASALLFLEGRVTFHYQDGSRPRAGHNSGGPSVLIAYGLDDADRLAMANLAGAFVPLACTGQVVAVLRPEPRVTWAQLLEEVVSRAGGVITLAIAYARLAEHPKAAANPNWQAKVRQTLQGQRFRRIGAMPTPVPVRGYELHAGAAAEARERVADHLRSRGALTDDAERAAEDIVRHGDFLTDLAPGQFDIIVGNPPYLRFGRLPAYYKDVYGDWLPDHARGDLQHAFLDRCVEVLAPSGRLGFITADRWLFNENAAALRAELGQRVGLVNVRRVDGRTAFYRPKHRVSGSPPRVHPVEIILGVGADRPLSRAAISPDTGCAYEAVTGTTLADVAEIKLAPWLGPDGIFVVDEVKARALDAKHVPVVRPRDIDPDGRITTRLVAIMTESNQRPSRRVLSHLRAAMANMPERGQRTMDRPGWWVPPERVTLNLDRPALLIPRISSGLRVIDLPAGILPLNHAMTVVGASDGPSLDQLRTYLLSEAAQAWIKAHAARLEGGFLSITTKLLRRMPVPAGWAVPA